MKAGQSVRWSNYFKDSEGTVSGLCRILSTGKPSVPLLRNPQGRRSAGITPENFQISCVAIAVERLPRCCRWKIGGTAAAAPPPFRPSEPALCGSCPLVTPYCCRLGDLLCFVFIVRLLCFSVVLYVSLQYFDTVGWVIWPVKTVSHITYTVLEGT